MKTCFIVNPRSGRAAHAASHVQRFAAARDAAMHTTTHRAHAAELAREAVAQGCECVVAVGGDGTMNEIASVLVGTPTALGLVPCGSGDGLGRHLGIHGSIAHALRIIESGVVRTIDSGLADGHPFFTVAGLGFEASIAEKFNGMTSRGLAGYLRTSARALGSWRPERYRVSHSGGIEEWDAFTVAVANASQYGNNARIAPKAAIDDGLLDLCAVPPLGWSNAVPLLTRLFLGSLTERAGMRFHRGSTFVIEREKPGPLHTDGEVHQAGTRVEFTVRPKSLRVIVQG